MVSTVTVDASITWAWLLVIKWTVDQVTHFFYFVSCFLVNDFVDHLRNLVFAVEKKLRGFYYTKCSFFVVVASLQFASVNIVNNLRPLRSQRP